MLGQHKVGFHVFCALLVLFSFVFVVLIFLFVLILDFFFLREKKNMKLGGYRGGEELGEEKEYDHNI